MKTARTLLFFFLLCGPAAAQDLPPDIAQLIEMVSIEGGTFIMGCTPEQGECLENELPVHKVRVSDFELSKYEVTQRLWEAVMGKTPSRFKNCPQCPVEKVSWNDIQNFFKALNQTGAQYRLPSEAEWEYAARGGRRSRGYKYAGSNNPDKIAWHQENSEKKTHPVGQKQENELGLYDLSGNVWEWVQDCRNDNYSGAPRDGRAWEEGNCSFRVLRGGSWSNEPEYLRSAIRYKNTTDYRSYYDGFRIARSLP